MQPSLYGYKLDELTSFLAVRGEPKYRAKQLFEWIYKRRITDFDALTNVSKSLRDALQEAFTLVSLQEVTRQVSSLDGTTKFLFALHDGATIETVIMPHDYGNSVCVSTQVGCKMGCKFCASTLGGLARNLTTGEIVEQVVHCQRLLDAKGERVSSVVLMGSGEPLDNYEAVTAFIDIITDPDGLQIGQRHITLSTVGIVPGIYRLADERRGITLAVSLHASDDEMRTRMMPVNKAYDIASLLEACHYYYNQTGRRITFEYALIKDHNDDKTAARKLADLIVSLPCHVNVIPINYVQERGLERTANVQIQAFMRELQRLGVNATARREMGGDISAACGQLRAEHAKEST
jgi:23S rRNA (adenine2503-C2)-methyltransferase